MQSFGAPRRRTAVVGDNFGPYRAPLTEKVGMECSAGFGGAPLTEKVVTVHRARFGGALRSKGSRSVVRRLEMIGATSKLEGSANAILWSTSAPHCHCG